jgi:hypothetical protein
MSGRTAVLIALALALAVPASAPARKSRAKAPVGFKAFLLNYRESKKHTFPRTPAFGWKPIKGARRYEFQLATSSSFRESSMIWSSSSLTAPYVSVPVALPWVTGHPYSLFARVRAKKRRGFTRWTSDYGFNVRWTEKPTQLSAPNGLLRWTPVEGASAYQVLELGYGWEKTALVKTNVSDMRDWFTFHQSSAWVGNAYWRVRAIRVTYGTPQDAVPVTSYGPWSPLFVTHATPPSLTQFQLSESVSNTRVKATAPAPHKLMPGFAWSGTMMGGFAAELYRVYVFSDSDCVQRVMTGSIIGSPAWVPRVSGPLKLPASEEAIDDARFTILEDGPQEEHVYDYAHHEVQTNEFVASETETGGGDEPSLDLWDRKWPGGVYYWTVVPVSWHINTIGDTEQFEYQDLQLPQDVCAAGRIGSFGKVSDPVPTVGKKAYVTSLSLSGKVRSVKAKKTPRVYGNTPLMTWTPVIGADEYELQWARKRNSLSSAQSLITPATSATPSLSPGRWYYRVRGVNSDMPSGARSMAWSTVRKVRIAKPVFRVSR